MKDSERLKRNSKLSANDGYKSQSKVRMGVSWWHLWLGVLKEEKDVQS